MPFQKIISWNTGHFRLMQYDMKVPLLDIDQSNDNSTKGFGKYFFLFIRQIHSSVSYTHLSLILSTAILIHSEEKREPGKRGIFPGLLPP